MGLKYTHSSLHEITNIRSVEQDNSHFKPKGLWLSINGEWEDWCEGNEWGGYKHLYEFKIDKTNILQFTLNDIKDFNKTFNNVELGPNYIDWKKVAEKYDGIEIFPYVRDFSLYNRIGIWYYGWDISSTCIWNKNAITSFRKI